VVGGKGAPNTRSIKVILESFDNGDREQCLEEWTSSLPPSVLKLDPTARRLEFYLQIFFAIYPLLVDRKAGFADAVAAFRVYIENKGYALAQTPEFLPFYALPYVPDPQAHPSFKHLFREDWAQDLRARVAKFLEMALASRFPELVEVYERGAGDGRKAEASVDAEMKKYRDKLARMESHHAAVLHHIETRHEALQEAFKDLLGLATQMQFALRAAVKGEAPSLDMVNDCKRRIAEYIAGGHLVELEPRAQAGGGGSGGGGGDGGVAGAVAAGDRRASSSSRPASASRQQQQQQQQPEDGPSGGERLARTPRRGPAVPAGPPPIPTPRLLAPLDYDKVKAALGNAGDPEGQAVLLQALRWRLTKTKAGPARRAALGLLVDADLLDLEKGPKSLLQRLTVAGGERVREQVARLLFAIAPESLGRSYLLRWPGSIACLAAAMRAEATDTPTQQALLGVLQKLSLRRGPQTAMIRGVDLIKWLCDLLKDADNLTDYTTEYSTALLMNLVLRHAGKLRCEGPDVDILNVLNNLLEAQQISVRNYVNGALYSVLSRPKIRDAARAMGMKEILLSLIHHSDESLRHQLEYILQQLNSDAADDAESDEDEDDPDEDEDDVNDDADDDDENGGATQTERESGQGLTGERLLCSLFLAEERQANRQNEALESSLRASAAQAALAPRPKSGAPRADRPLDRPATPRGAQAAPPDSSLDNPLVSRDKIPRTPWIEEDGQQRQPAQPAQPVQQQQQQQRQPRPAPSSTPSPTPGAVSNATRRPPSQTAGASSSVPPRAPVAKGKGKEKTTPARKRTPPPDLPIEDNPFATKPKVPRSPEGH
jgi:hypothetical protein